MATIKTTEISRTLVSEKSASGKYSIDLLRLSIALRTAEATEAMAGNYKEMQKDLSWYMGQFHAQKAQIEKLRGTITALKGQSLKLKKPANEF